MSSLNKAEIIGNLTRDPEVKQTQNGKFYTSLSVATNREWTDKNTGERKKDVEYHNVVLWGRIAEIAGQYLHKGDKAFFSGRLQTRSWEKEGHKNYRTEIVVDNLIMLNTKPKQNTSEDLGPDPSQEDLGQISVEDLPF
jgi:single-strand DNA-binding protein